MVFVASPFSWGCLVFPIPHIFTLRPPPQCPYTTPTLLWHVILCSSIYTYSARLEGGRTSQFLQPVHHSLKVGTVDTPSLARTTVNPSVVPLVASGVPFPLQKSGLDRVCTSRLFLFVSFVPCGFYARIAAAVNICIMRRAMYRGWSKYALKLPNTFTHSLSWVLVARCHRRTYLK